MANEENFADHLLTIPRRVVCTLYREPFMLCVVIGFGPGILARNTDPQFLTALVAGWAASWFADNLWQDRLNTHGRETRK